jgi:3-methyladenine DNA glycosylase AlkD
MIAALQATLRALATPERAAQEKRYLKSADDFLGVTVPASERVARDFHRAHPDADIRAVATALWASGWHEEKRLAVQLFETKPRLLTAADWPLLLCWVRDASSWDLVDGIAAHLQGALLDSEPRFEADVDAWVADPDPWVRRAALVAQVCRLRRGTVPAARIRALCAALLADREYFVRKALGWLLRECAVHDPDATETFLRTHPVPRPVLREAVRKWEPARQARVLSPPNAG